jgi:predicted Zn-dependent protease
MRNILMGILVSVFTLSTISAQTPQQLLDAAKKATKGDVKKENLASVQKAVDDALKAPENQSGFEAYLYKAKLMLSMGKLDEEGRLKASVTGKPYKSEFTKSALDAVSSAMMALKNTKDPKATKEIYKVLSDVAPYINNYASDLSEAKDYLGAYQSFKAGTEVHDALKAGGQKGTLEKPEEYSKQLYLTGLLATYADKEEEAMPIYEKMLASKIDSSFVYNTLYKLKKKSDPEGALKILEAGRKRYPEETSLLFTEINYYLEKGQMDILLERLKEGIAREPNNITLYFTMGNVYDNLGQKEKDPTKAAEYANLSLDWYKKTLEKDPKNADAMYSIGAYYYNKAAKISAEIKKVESDMSKAGQKKYDELTKSMLAEFDVALPYFQKSEALDANNQNALIALKEIYARKNDMTLTKEFKTRLENITSGGKNEKPYFKL